MFRTLSQKEIDWCASSNSIIIMTEPKVNLSTAIVFLTATAAGGQVPQVKWSKLLQHRATRACPCQFSRNMSRRRCGIAAGRLWSCNPPGPFGPCLCACPPSENPPSESRATYAPRQGWPNPILLFARLDAAELHDCKRNTEIHPSRASCK